MDPFEFSLQFARGIGEVDPAKGILRGVTVAEVGEARGHFAFVNQLGEVLGVGASADLSDYPTGTRRLQLAMDERSLQTVVEAAKRTPRVRTREDHDDGIGARAGFAENFRMQDGRVVCDQTIFGSYRNRSVLFETAAATPELIGLSGEFMFTAEVVGTTALMRVTRVDAIDIVDQGALTHAGLFSVKKARAVDSTEKGKVEHLSSMASHASPVDLKHFRSLCEQLVKYRSEHADAGAAIEEALAGLGAPAAAAPAGPAAAPAAPGVGTPPAGGATEGAVSAAALSALKTELTASFAKQIETATAAAKAEGEKAAKAELLEFKKSMGALGINPAAAPGAPSNAPAPGAPGAPAPDGKQDFFTVRAKVAAERKISLSRANHVVIAEQPELYRAYQIKAGIISDPAAPARN